MNSWSRLQRVWHGSAVSSEVPTFQENKGEARQPKDFNKSND